MKKKEHFAVFVPFFFARRKKSSTFASDLTQKA
jgi:hypothetical protein